MGFLKEIGRAAASVPGQILGQSRSGGMSYFNRQRQEFAAIERSKHTSLLKEIQDDKEISDVTRQELITQLGTDNSTLGATRKRLLAAQEGIEPIFKSRQQSQRMFEQLTDMPGRRQTILSAGRKSN